MPDNFSESGPIDDSFILEGEPSATYEVISSRKYSRLVKTKRQGRWFVLKCLRDENRGQAVSLELLKKEYALMVQLDHPNIVKSYAKEVNEKFGPCIVMEYIDGERLDTFLARDPSKETRRKIVGELVDALSYIHSKQILHRDLKPSNILVTRNGNNVKIIDFGLSDADDYAILKESAGTLEYMAPEVVSGKAADCRSDIYSFGLILRSIFPRRFRRIARKCTRKGPGERYGSMEAVRKALERNGRRRRVLPLLCSVALLVVASSFLVRQVAGSHQEAADAADNVTPDQIAYLEGAYWYVQVLSQDFFKEVEDGRNYREVMVGRLVKLNNILNSVCSEMSCLYPAGSEEQVHFISEYKKMQDYDESRSMGFIGSKCHSFEEDFAKGRIGQRTLDSLRWVVSPKIVPLPITDITASSAVGGVELSDASFAKDMRAGLCWGPSHNPTTRGRHAVASRPEDRRRIVMTGLIPGTTYFVRPYVETGAGTTYAAEISFTTADSTFAVPEGAVKGLFSVAEGRQVHFSRGNLQYRASTRTWRFAPRQQDYVGEDNTKLSPEYDGWIDLFGWGTSGYDHGAVNWQPWSSNLGTVSNALDQAHDAYGVRSASLHEQSGKADWGYNRISNGGNEENLWRTPRVPEWLWILFNRNTASGARFAKAKVDGVNGLVILPDNWKVSEYPLSSVNQVEADFTSNDIPESDWTRFLEPAGAAFLPEAGVRTISGIFPRFGAYYTSDAASTDAYHILMNEGALIFDSRGHRGDGCSVRLVQDYRPTDAQGL